MSLVNLTVDGIAVQVESGSTILDVIKKVQDKITPEINAKVDETMNEWFGPEEVAQNC